MAAGHILLLFILSGEVNAGDGTVQSLVQSLGSRKLKNDTARPFFCAFLLLCVQGLCRAKDNFSLKKK